MREQMMHWSATAAAAAAMLLLGACGSSEDDSLKISHGSDSSTANTEGAPSGEEQPTESAAPTDPAAQGAVAERYNALWAAVDAGEDVTSYLCPPAPLSASDVATALTHFRETSTGARLPQATPESVTLTGTSATVLVGDPPVTTQATQRDGEWCMSSMSLPPTTGQ